MEGLGINLQLLIAQIINFLILLGLLYLFAYKPILRMFDERSRRIKDSMELTDMIREQAASAEKEANNRIEQASRDGQDIVAQAIKQGEDIKQKAEYEAKPEAEMILEKARQDAQRERKEAIDELKKQFSDLTITAAQKVIEQELDAKKHRELIDKVFEESDLSKKD